MSKAEDTAWVLCRISQFRIDLREAEKVERWSERGPTVRILWKELQDDMAKKLEKKYGIGQFDGKEGEAGIIDTSSMGSVQGSRVGGGSGQS